MFHSTVFLAAGSTGLALWMICAERLWTVAHKPKNYASDNHKHQRKEGRGGMMFCKDMIDD